MQVSLRDQMNWIETDKEEGRSLQKTEKRGRIVSEA